MNPNGEDIVQKIVLTTDEASAQKSTRTINDARAQVQGLAGDLQKVSSSGTGASVQFNSVAEAAARLGLSEAQIAALTSEEQRATQQARELAGSLEQAATQAKAVGGAASGGFNLGGARQVLGVAGGLASTVGGGQAVSAASSVLGLTAALGPMGVALGAGTLAIKAVTDAEQKRTEAAKEYVDAVSGAAGQTTEQIQAQIDAEKARVGALSES